MRSGQDNVGGAPGGAQRGIGGREKAACRGARQHWAGGFGAAVP